MLDATVTALLKALELGVEMRRLQTHYFRYRSTVALRDAQKAERAFDAQAKAALEMVGAQLAQNRLLP